MPSASSVGLLILVNLLLAAISWIGLFLTLVVGNARLAGLAANSALIRRL